MTKPTVLNPFTNLPFTSLDVARVLGYAEQFLAEWIESADQGGCEAEQQEARLAQIAFNSIAPTLYSSPEDQFVAAECLGVTPIVSVYREHPNDPMFPNITVRLLDPKAAALCSVIDQHSPMLWGHADGTHTAEFASTEDIIKLGRLILEHGDHLVPLVLRLGHDLVMQAVLFDCMEKST